MKQVFMMLLCLVCFPSWAAPVSFSFAAVPLVDFAQFTYRDLLKRDYVLSSELVGMNKKITINVKAVDESQLVPFVDQVLQSQGIRSTQKGGVFYLEPAASASLVDAGASPGAPVAVPGGAVPPVAGDRVQQPGVPGPVAVLVPEKEFKVLTVSNRSAEFVAEAVNAVVGSVVARPAGGNRLALTAPKPRLKALQVLVDQLDLPADVVEVSASFVEVTTNGGAASGLSLVASVLNGRTGVSVLTQQGRVSVAGGGYELVLQALASDGRFKQVSNSRVVGDDASKLLLSVGDETPTIGTSSTDNQGNLLQSVVYRPSGVILDVLPRVLGSGRLSLAVDGQVSSFQATTTGVSGSPTLVKRQVKTSVSVADSEVLVIGGLNDTKSVASSAGFSFLPATWRTKSDQDTKTDLVLILSAKVLK
jgi:general secretion pathway protein D